MFSSSSVFGGVCCCSCSRQPRCSFLRFFQYASVLMLPDSVVSTTCAFFSRTSKINVICSPVYFFRRFSAFFVKGREFLVLGFLTASLIFINSVIGIVFFTGVEFSQSSFVLPSAVTLSFRLLCKRRWRHRLPNLIPMCPGFHGQRMEGRGSR